MAKTKMMTIRVEEEVHKQIKIKAASEGISIADYITKLATDDIEVLKNIETNDN